jgi:hypothetical protein
LIAPLAKARCLHWLASLAAIFAREAAVFVESDETTMLEDQL